MNNDTNILTMPDVSAQMSIDADSQALIEAISTAITNGFNGLNTLQVDAVAQIETNTQNIATNTQNIATNTQDIATNTQNIATNTQDIATNTQDIATNTQDIATNTQNIATNTQNIATNTQNIATNTQNITNMSSAMGDITYKKISTIYYGTPKILTVSNNFRGKLILMDSSKEGCGEYFIYSASSGKTYWKSIIVQTRTTIIAGAIDNIITLEVPEGAGILLFVESFQGTFTIS